MILATSILDWLLGLRRLSWSDWRAALGWRWPMPLWAWVLVVIGAAAIGLWSYRSLLGPRPVKFALGVLRATLVLAIAALLVGPMLVVNQELVEPDALLVLVDQSASMDVRDMPGNGNTETISRGEALEAAIKKHAALFGDQKLGRDRRIIWLGFAGNTYEINPFDPKSQPPPEQERQATAIRTAIEQALQRGAGRPLSGIVLMSDGRSSETVGPGLIHRLQQQAVNIFTVPLGAKRPMIDLGLAEIEAPEKAFINDPVPVTVWLDHSPDNVKIDPARLLVRLVDTQTGRVLDERHPDDDTLRRPVRLGAASDSIGPVPWRVELIYDQPAGGAERAGAGLPAELPGAAPRVLLTRKQEDVSVELLDQPLGVLYVEGYPRWEFRYLKNMLIREKSIRASTFLLSADRNFAQEGQIPITRLPTTAEELKPYDVIIIGDVPASYFSVDQLKLIADHVATGGAGLLWIGGERDTPQSYEGTPLGGLLPMRSPGMVSRIDPSIGPVQITPTPLAEAIQVLRLRSPDAPVDSAEPAWSSNLSPLPWAQNLGELKDSAEVLATAAPASASTSGGLPVIVRMRYGAGDVLYVGTDETWRWRYGRGDVYFERLWMQLIRLLGRARLQQGGGRAVLDVSSHRLEAEQAAVVSLRINDELLRQRELPKVSVAVTRMGEPANKAVVLEKIELLPVPKSSGEGKPSEPGVDYQAIWRPTVPGRLMLRVDEPGLEDLNAGRAVEVVGADDELRHPVPDREKMAELAEQTGGKVLSLDRLDDLATLVPNRARRTPNDIREPLWNSYLAMIVVVTLLTAEWIGRKAIRLV